MTAQSKSTLAGDIIEKAKYFGATLAGIASVDALKQSPSHLLYPELEQYSGVGSSETAGDIKPGEVAWPPDARSAVVIAVEHEPGKPELDWWDGKGTPGNRILIRINKDLSDWVEESLQIKTYRIPYYVEKGGIFLKDAAVMAGLGCIGKNNLLVTPELGPRVRLRALLLTEEVEPTGPVEFDPCKGCNEPCRRTCPVGAFENHVYPPEKTGLSSLPGRSGCYSRVLCNTQMEKDVESSGRGEGARDSVIKFCRDCELNCVAGKR